MHKLIRLKLLSAWHTSAWKVTTSLSFCLASMKLKGIRLACGESFPNNNNNNNKKSKNNIFFAIDHLPRNDVDTFHTLINTVRLCGQFFYTSWFKARPKNSHKTHFHANNCICFETISFFYFLFWDLLFFYKRMASFYTDSKRWKQYMSCLFTYIHAEFRY